MAVSLKVAVLSARTWRKRKLDHKRRI